MKKVTLFCVIVMFCANLFSQDTDAVYKLKNHNFGIGLSITPVATNHQYIQEDDKGYGSLYYINKEENFNFNLSLLYEYDLNRHIRLGIAPTYRHSWKSTEYMNNKGKFFRVSENISDVDIPLYVDYKLWWGETSNVFLGTGFSGMFNIDVKAAYRERDSFSEYLMFRLGVELKRTHTFQLVVQYRINLAKNNYYNATEWDSNTQEYFVNKYAFRWNTLDIGFNFFF
ncbi:MAG: hypothetical protein IJ213_09540 [Bacteroidales bacterium]|nr:hypothetical protein [Bacteroidales bacterium]